MSLKDTVNNDVKTAMKSGETEKRDTLRLLASASHAGIRSSQELGRMQDWRSLGVPGTFELICTPFVSSRFRARS